MGRHAGVRDARNNERQVCGRRRDSEPAGTGPLSGSREASFRADPATECGSNPIARSKQIFPDREPLSLLLAEE